MSSAEINEIIQKELIPLKDFFWSYSHLIKEEKYRFDGKQSARLFGECARRVQSFIETARKINGN